MQNKYTQDHYYPLSLPNPQTIACEEVSVDNWGYKAVGFDKNYLVLPPPLNWHIGTHLRVTQ